MNRFTALLITASAAIALPAHALLPIADVHPAHQRPLNWTKPTPRSNSETITVTGEPLKIDSYPGAGTVENEVYMMPVDGGPLYMSDVKAYNVASNFCFDRFRSFENSHPDIYISYKAWVRLGCMQRKMQAVPGSSRLMLFIANYRDPEPSVGVTVEPPAIIK